MDNRRPVARVVSRDVQRRANSPRSLPPPESAAEYVAKYCGALFVAGTKNETRSLRQATPADLKFVDKLQRRFGHSVGFLCTEALKFNLEHDHVAIALENGEPAGYLLGRPGLGWQPLLTPIFQACVAMDAQRRHHGLALLLLLEERSRASGKIGVQANCAIGVEANEFWQAAGFKPICHMTPKTARGREIICWRKPLVRCLPDWFLLPPRRSGHMARNPLSIRNPNRRPKDQQFAERFLTGSQLPAGDPNHVDAGLLHTLDQLGTHTKGN
jgi:N-acetylglutamate synthase-like GNAT family acetyltransferase